MNEAFLQLLASSLVPGLPVFGPQLQGLQELLVF